MSGLELHQQLAEAGSQIPVIFISAHDEPQARSRAMEGGAVGFLSKPFDDEDLLEALCAALRRRRARRQNGGAL